MLTDTQRFYERASQQYHELNRINWSFAAQMACLPGTYRDKADYIGGISDDKVRNAAHAWEMYRDLWRAYGPVLVSIRRLPYVYLSHFLALHSIRKKYGLPLPVIHRYLGEVVQGEGSISSDNIRTFADREFGAERALPYEADRARRGLVSLLTRGDLTTRDRKLFVQALARLEQLSGQ